MADKSKIEWTDATWNPIRGCSVVSEGCRNCYAMAVAARFSGEGQAYEGLAYRNESGAHWTGKVRLIEEHLEDPLRWKKPRRIFVNSMSDLFHESIPDEWIDKIFAVMALAGFARQHTFQVLTKRPERMRDYFLNRQKSRTAEHGAEAATFYHIACRVREMVTTLDGRNPSGFYLTEAMWPLSNVWLGVSVEDQKTADERIPILLQTPAKVRWISAEPLLGPIDLTDLPIGWTWLHDGGLDWVVVGGESGTGARPMHPEWARSLRDQCVDAGVKFFFKQWGGWLAGEVFSEGTRGGLVRHQDGSDGGHGGSPDHWWSGDAYNGTISTRVGKKTAGRLLDGRTWDEYP